MDRDAEKPFVVDRINSFPRDRAYPSSAAHPQTAEKNTDDLFFGPHRLHREGTSDHEIRRSNKRLRYTIPLRQKKKQPLKDEEKGILDGQGNENVGHLTRPGLERDTSRGGPPYGADDLYEIISTQFWVPDDEGGEVVTLTVTDDTTSKKQDKTRYESRWRHIQSDAITFRHFHKEVMMLPGLEDDDLALASRLLNKVRKTCEKQFIHGRYLKPVVLVYDGADPEEGSEEPKTATFVSLPIFTTDVLRRHTFTKDDEGHPVRALLQSRYRLESTKSRDKGQVIRKIQRHNEHVVLVPQIWALIINKHTIITCAPLNTSTLRGESIRIVRYADAQLDEATWSVHFTDARGTVFYLPLRFCKTWFGLVKQITDDCLQDEFKLIRDQLLKSGPLYQLVTDEGVPVTAESWPKMIEDERREVIRLRLVDNEGISNRLLVTYCDADGNELPCESDSSSDASSLFSLDDVESDATDTSTNGVQSVNRVAPAVRKLRSLHRDLEQAKSEENVKRIERLRDHRIPALEDRILELTAADLDAEQKRAHSQKRAQKRMPDPSVDRQGSFGRLPGNAMTSAASARSTRRRSRSRSWSRPRLAGGSSHYFQSTHDLSLEDSQIYTRQKRPSLAYARSQSVSQPQNIFGDYSFPATRRQSYASIGSHRPKLLSDAAPLKSRWDIVRSRVLNGPGFSAVTTPQSPKSSKNDIYYKPSNKQLARSRWEFLRAQILAGKDLGQSNGHATGQNVDEPASPRVRDKLANAMKLVFKEEELTSPKPASTVNHVNDPGDQAPEQQSKRVKFATRSQEAKPKLKRLITRAHKEVSRLTSPHFTTAPPPVAARSPIMPSKTQDLPIFLWSTVHKPASVADISMASRIASVSNLKGADETILRDVAATVKYNTSKEELILRTVVLEIHANLRKPKRVPLEYADLYENIAEKTFDDVESLMAAMESNNGEINHNEKRDTSSPLGSPEVEASDAVDSSTICQRLKDTRSALLDVASRILYAFVPEGYEAALVSKYWGAIYQILSQRSRVRIYDLRKLPR